MAFARTSPARSATPPPAAEKIEPLRAEDSNGVLDHGLAAMPDSPPPHVEPPRIGKVKGICLTAVCATAMLMNIATNNGVTIALPSIGKDLDVEESKLQWLVSAYSLSSGCLLLVLGRLADLYGRRRVYLAGSFWLMALSLGCAFINDPLTLMILRGIQGIGGAAVVPSALGILAHAFPPGSRSRSIAFATFGAGAPIGGVLSLLIGGALTQFTSEGWRSIFYFMACLAFVCFAGGLLTMPPDPPSTEKDRRVDWLGALLSSSGLVLIVFVLADGEEAPNKWATPYIIVLLILGVALMVAFGFWQRYLERVQDDPNATYSYWTPPPVMRLSLFARGHWRYGAQMLVVFTTWSSFIGYTYWQMLFYQDFLGLSPINAAVRLIPMPITGLICNIIVALLVGRVPVVALMGTGTVATTTANLLFATISNRERPYWAYGFVPAILAVFGTDFVFSSGTIFVQKLSQPHEQSVSGALFSTMTQLGSAFGLAITTVVYNRIQSERGDDVYHLESFHAAHYTSFGLGIVACCVTIISLRGVGIVGHVKKNKMTDSDPERTAANSVASGAKDETTEKN
ncbi:major facilitator superfamily domain-containing protein [Schizophyllum amplum]|uniref:Major facilitator superfamily domain-containing protein n=1 Tax=Schizophyllum amplum TaxID=97359 RepID=A0A550C5V4_9AGAR|nr:major facilitator superfamily domain-containing protein [Auriculariopsis ampla]